MESSVNELKGKTQNDKKIFCTIRWVEKKFRHGEQQRRRWWWRWAMLGNFLEKRERCMKRESFIARPRPGAFRCTKHDANCEARATLLRPAVLDLLIECIAVTGRGTARTAKHERPCLGQRKEQLMDQAHRPLVTKFNKTYVLGILLIGNTSIQQLECCWWNQILHNLGFKLHWIFYSRKLLPLWFIASRKMIYVINH